MNERFMKLAKDSGLYHELPNGDLYPMAMSAEECGATYKKFAELIVQDCYGILEKYSRANMESDAWVQMITMMQKELNDHFGVER